LSYKKIIRASLEQEELEGEGPVTEGEVFTDFHHQHHSRVCAGCSCLCDDISFYVKEGRIVRTLNLCEIGWNRLAPGSAGTRLPSPSPSLLSDSLQRAAELLRSHAPVLVLGADNLEESAIRLSREVARTLRGVWLPWSFPAVRRFYERVARYGWATALLDEVRDHAGAVFFWRTDPLKTHHRHLSRYSFFARGRYTERGNHDRNLAAVDAEETLVEPLCQQFFVLPEHRDPDLIRALLVPVAGKGFDHRDFSFLAGALEKASYAAFFIDPARITDPALDLLFQGAAEINALGKKRMVILPIWNAGSNMEGFCQVSLEKDASAWGADYSGSQSGTNPAPLDWDLLSQRVASVLMIEPGPGQGQGPELPGSLAGKPRVVIDPLKTHVGSAKDIVIPASLPGVESDGVYLRADGIPLNASRIVSLGKTEYPTSEEILTRLLHELESLGDRPQRARL